MRKFAMYLIPILVLISGCGYKFPLPPENPGTLPSEEDYLIVRNTSWDNQVFSEIRDILVGKDGYIYVLERGALLRYNTNGDLVELFHAGFADARSVAQDVSRRLYVADSSQILVFSRDRELLYIIDFGDSLFPCGIDVNFSGEIIISDSARNKVVRIDSTGSLLETIASEGSGILSVMNPHGIFIDEKYFRILVASTGNNWVEGLSINLPRVSMVHLGGITHEGGDTAGVFLYPTDVWVDTLGYIYVLDYGNRRIQKFDFEGKFVHLEDFTNFPISMATSKDGMYLYVAFSDRIVKMKKPELPQNPGGN